MKKKKGTVYFNSAKGKWIAEITVDNMRFYIGSFNSQKKAKTMLKNWIAINLYL